MPVRRGVDGFAAAEKDSMRVYCCNVCSKAVVTGTSRVLAAAWRAVPHACANNADAEPGDASVASAPATGVACTAEDKSSCCLPRSIACVVVGGNDTCGARTITPSTALDSAHATRAASSDEHAARALPRSASSTAQAACELRSSACSAEHAARAPLKSRASDARAAASRASHAAAAASVLARAA
eukprot:197407-Chlamydomonas_euryale.AAC.1